MSLSLDADLKSLSNALEPVEHAARGLAWARSRPWASRTHLGAVGGLPAIDLHDLSVKLALDAVQRSLDVPLQTGGLVLITGRGRHSGGRSALRDAVLGRLSARAERGELAVRTLGPGRVEVIVDPTRVRASRPGMGPLFWILVALVIAGILAALLEGWGAA